MRVIVETQPVWDDEFLALDEAVAQKYLGYSSMDIVEAVYAGMSVDETVAMLQERYRERDERDFPVSEEARKAAKVRRAGSTVTDESPDTDD